MSSVVIKRSTNPYHLNDAAYHLPFLKVKKQTGHDIYSVIGTLCRGDVGSVTDDSKVNSTYIFKVEDHHVPLKRRKHFPNCHDAKIEENIQHQRWKTVKPKIRVAGYRV